MQKWLRSLATALRWESETRRDLSAMKSYSLWLPGLCCTCAFSASSCDTVRFVRSMLDTFWIRECLGVDQTDPTVRAGSTICNVRPNGREHSRGKYLRSQPGFRTFEKIVEEARLREMALVSLRLATKDTLAYLMFSSGTTGPPKVRWNTCQWFHIY